jgi:Polysaccharide pyruvyl transferase
VRPTLFATPATAQALAETRAAVILVGGYDGSGNYGDITLLEAALELVERLGPGLVVLPLLERSFLADHRALAAEGKWASRAIFFDPGGELEDDLLPLAAPPELSFGACYLYGGGYLNRAWGERKLAMLRAAEDLLEAGGTSEIYRLASGLQVEADWIAQLDEADAAALRCFDFLGVRDSGSAEALEALDATTAVAHTADDAVGVLRRLPAPNGVAAANGNLHVNLHFAEHGWVSERPAAVLDFYAGLVAELGRLADRPVVAQPVIAYLDRRVDERAAVDRLSAACSALGAEMTEPLLLRPAALAEAAPRLREGAVTLSCSYHVALTSLMLEVPAVLLGDTPYYAQKAAGLLEDFELPPVFTPAAGADPVASARELAGPVLDGATEFRRHLAGGAGRLRRRRTATETDLLGRLGGAAVTAFDGQVAELTERLRRRSAEPAELQARLSRQQTELEELRRLLSESPLDAELRVQEAEARAGEAQETLAELLGSRSWKLSAPLRRAGARLRRR